MSAHVNEFRTMALVAVASAMLAGCVSHSVPPEGSEAVRAKLTQLQSDPQLATRAPDAIKEAELAVIAAEKKQSDKTLETHLVFMADRKVDVAAALAQTRLSEDQRKSLSDQRDGLRLAARTQEADMARGDARLARSQADAARGDAATARTQASTARNDAELARIDAGAARGEADAAYVAADAATQQAEDLQQQLDLLKAKPTERGMVVTLGDVLFESGKSELKSGAAGNLSNLAAFLKKYPERTVLIEGHTDSLGSDSFNQGLSQQRANAVKFSLVNQGIAANRLTATGKGESTPVSGNDSDLGRQQNRRVEVVISNVVTAAK